MPNTVKKKRRRRIRAERGVVYKILFDKDSGPPKKRWRFKLQRVGQGADGEVVFTMPTDFELWCESILAEAYRRIDRRLGEVTIIPTRNVVRLFADIREGDL